MERFEGKVYLKKTAWDGMAKLGVIRVGRDRYAVYWCSKNGNYTPFLPDIFQDSTCRHGMQMLLDTWAAEKQLRAA